ncbi:hypothetical protein [Hydrogenovibrio marinus]|uniref:Lactate permease n=1 Tax=Hydrogenovibrio marinus TaxID=28885 RepID=A0A066ZRW0_HYDMR|nr:hypothetical protein [Hydrogenovibrio marinus]KDN96192.1 hypothetical protein EI16_07855 [Hydrogenovibrio marinus]BBN60630.1 hypothetical protein HVMH_2224 [Hydrogenovibrio marinus]
MSKNIEAFMRQQQILKAKRKPLVSSLVDAGLVTEMLEGKVNHSPSKPFSLIAEITSAEGISEQEVYGLLDSIKDRFHDERLESMVDQLKSDVMHAIVVPFGLGKVLAAYDKTGGNVTTLHNFEKGVVATTDDQKRYEEWQDSFNNGIDRKGKHKVHDVIKDKWKKEEFQSIEKGASVTDGYSGKELGVKDGNNVNKHVRIDGEHVTSVKELELDPKNHLYAQGTNGEERLVDRAQVSGHKDNLTLVEGTMNNSKQDKDLKEWADSKITQDNAKKTGDPDMTNAEFYDLDSKLVEEKYKKSKKHIKNEQIKKQIKKQGQEVLLTSATEAAKMGWQQAFGMVLVELFSNIIQEIKNLMKEGIDKNKWLEEISTRFKRIAKNVLSKWKDVLHAFKDGAISGFISNIVTTLINVFATTAKRTVRMIREGVFSLYRALKMLAFPPEGMSFEAVAHETMKLLFAGGIVIGGVLLEEIIEKAILAIPLLVPIAGMLTALVVGSLTAISMSLMAYIWDKLDLFGAIKNQEDDFVLNQLENSIQTNRADIDDMLASFSY